MTVDYPLKWTIIIMHLLCLLLGRAGMLHYKAQYLQGIILCKLYIIINYFSNFCRKWGRGNGGEKSSSITKTICLSGDLLVRNEANITT